MIAVCGEALIDLLPTGPAGYEAVPGGSPANTAVALARLGAPVTMLARLSHDGFGRQLRAHLDGNGVDLAHAVEAAEDTSLAIVTRADDGSAAYRFVLDGTADWAWRDDELGPLPSSVVALHTGSLALQRTPAIEAFLGRARETATVSIDPNLRPGKDFDRDAAVQAMARWVALADVVKASTDDVDLLHPGADPVELARSWASAGPGLVVVTGGAAGAIAVTAAGVVRREALPTDVVDTVGAGDTFTAGLLHVLHERGCLGSRLDRLSAEDVDAALDLALRAAAVTCSRRGADPPYARELQGHARTTRG